MRPDQQPSLFSTIKNGHDALSLGKRWAKIQAELEAGNPEIRKMVEYYLSMKRVHDGQALHLNELLTYFKPGLVLKAREIEMRFYQQLNEFQTIYLPAKVKLMIEQKGLALLIQNIIVEMDRYNNFDTEFLMASKPELYGDNKMLNLVDRISREVQLEETRHMKGKELQNWVTCLGPLVKYVFNHYKAEVYNSAAKYDVYYPSYEVFMETRNSFPRWLRNFAVQLILHYPVSQNPQTDENKAQSE